MLTQCPNCRTSVSTDSTICVGCRGPLRPVQRDVARPVFVWAFIAFNVLMIGWLAVFLIGGKADILSPRILSARFDTGDAAGTPIGGGFGLGYLVTLWIWGTIVLGLFAIPTVSAWRKQDGQRQSRGR